jgi:hypothetical protein
MRVAAEAARTAIASERTDHRYLFNDRIKTSTMTVQRRDQGEYDDD